MMNVEYIFETIKHVNIDDDNCIFDIIQHVFSNSCSCYEVAKLQQISHGELKKVYLSEDKCTVYKIKEVQSGLYSLIEELYLLNKTLKEDFAMDFASLEKQDDKYIICFVQNYYMPFICKDKLDSLKLKVCINKYMENISYQLDKVNSCTDDNFNLEYFNDKYQIFDLTNNNVTLIDGKKLFFYDANMQKL